MQRNNMQPTFTDLTVSDLGGPKATAFFERCLAEWLNSNTGSPAYR